MCNPEFSIYSSALENLLDDGPIVMHFPLYSYTNRTRHGRSVEWTCAVYITLPQPPQYQAYANFFVGARSTRDISMGDGVMSGPFYWSAQFNLLMYAASALPTYNFSACWPAHLPQLHKKSPRPLFYGDGNGSHHDYTQLMKIKPGTDFLHNNGTKRVG